MIRIRSYVVYFSGASAPRRTQVAVALRQPLTGPLQRPVNGFRERITRIFSIHAHTRGAILHRGDAEYAEKSNRVGAKQS